MPFRNLFIPPSAGQVTIPVMNSAPEKIIGG